MISGIIDGSYSMFGPAIGAKKPTEKSDSLDSSSTGKDPNPIFEAKERLSMFTESGNLATSDRIGQNLNIKI